jgi:class 3 adenylate cyclase
MSATPDSTLANPEQLIADLHHQLTEREAELAECKSERDEALQRETATAEALQVINASPGNLAPVFDAILEKAHTLCGAEFGSLFLYNREQFRAMASHGVPEALASRLREGVGADDSRSHEQLIAGAPFAHIHDTALEERTLYRGMDMVSSRRTILAVPLRKGDALLGSIVAGRLEARSFTDKQIALLQNFAAQAVIAMENARLLTETREALEQQTATAEVLGVINASPGDLGPVFEAILEKAHTLCGASIGALATYDGQHFRVVAHRGFSLEYEAVMARPFQPSANSSFDRLLGGENVIHITDLAAFASRRPDGDNPMRRAALEVAGSRTLLFVALRKDGKLLGYITAHRREVRPFSDKQIALLQNFAEQAVIAMENARLLTETQVALEQQTATAEVLQVINSSPGDLASVFDAMLEKALHLCSSSFGFMADYDGEYVRVMAERGIPAELAEFHREPYRVAVGTPMSRFLQGEEVFHTVDAISDLSKISPRGQAYVDLGGARSFLAVPMRKDGGLLGCFLVFRQHVEAFSAKQIALLQSFAAQAVIAMENARLLGELRQRTDEVAELNRGLEARVAEQVEELGRVGRLKRFLAPQLAELIVSHGDEKILESHRREIVVVFCDLRGYTAFTETAEPEEVLDFLRQYHGALGPLVSQFEGTLDQFSGDGIMVFFNDPVPCPDPAERAVKMAMAMREAASTLIAHWRERGRDLGFGAGIAQGYATLGQIGFSERSGYTAIGTVCNVAARLCAEAKDGQILLSQLVNVALKGSVATEQLGPLALKGLTQPVVAYNVPLAAIQPDLRVIEGGPQSV